MTTKINDSLIDELVKNCKTAKDVLGARGVIKELTKRLFERMLNAELRTHLGYEKNQISTKEKDDNSRNGHSSKTVLTKDEEIEFKIPRDRKGIFEPQVIPKHKRRFDDFDSKITSMFARGMSLNDIKDHMKEIYGVEVSPTLISNVTDAVIEDVREWQNRALDQIYPVVFFDVIMVKRKTCGLSCSWNKYGRTERTAWYVDSRQGRSKILAQCNNRNKESWSQ